MYQALYRVWRPKTFRDMVGQETVAQTLKNAVSQQKISHAYLFSGPRGTGKTSAAKIFAKAINCDNQQDGEPCNECVNCQMAAQGTLADVVEIDAASNNGVDEIRDIRDKSRYAPTQAQYKVYIIDEVHMLSIGAFNALLKTLEEPTQNVIFILATTEVHKIPATILSRVQRFEFKRITALDIERRLIHILEHQKQAFDIKAVQIIARMANGGMRDALSLLDQALAYTQDTLSVEVAQDITGSLSDDVMMDYVLATFHSDTKLALQHLHHLLTNGKIATRIVEELLVFVKDVLVWRLDEADDRYERVNNITQPYFYAMIDVLAQVQQQLKQQIPSDVSIEVMTIQLCQLPKVTVNVTDDELVRALQNRIDHLENRIRQLEQGSVAIPVAPTHQAVVKTPPKPVTEFKVKLENVFAILSQATREDKDRVSEEWSDILSCLTVQQRAKLNASTVLAASPTGVVIGFAYDLLCGMTDSDEMLKQAISEHALRLINHPCHIECVPNNQWQSIRSQYVQLRQTEKKVEQDVLFEEDTPKNELVEQATQLFGDLVEIKEEQ